jgi:hypothetical protein
MGAAGFSGEGGAVVGVLAGRWMNEWGIEVEMPRDEQGAEEYIRGRGER